MKFLIINADDVGFSGPINEAVKKGCQAGSITGVSVMACGAFFNEAVSMLKEIGKKETGVHLTLTGKCGKFAESYKDFALKYFMKKIDPGKVYAELSSQIRKVRDAGFDVTHLDSHEHVHMFPEILKLTIKLAEEYDIPYIRFPRESSRVMTKKFSVGDLARHISLAAFTSAGKKRIHTSSLKYNEHFLGHFHAGRIDEDSFRFMLDNLREGITELAVHPSVRSETFFRESPWYKNAEKEFDLLVKKDWKEELGSLGIRLVTHKKIVAEA
jgi:predicted glycoside hydrolase/deacetylase ChbG (UPF0249 family)